MGGTKIATSDKVATGSDEIIERAARRGVSDIHIEPGPRFVQVRYRQGGALYVANKLPLAHTAPLARYFKKLAKLDLSQTAAPQNGQYERHIGRQGYIVEVATLPVLGGEKLTIKLHKIEASAPSLEQLGLWGANLEAVQRALAAERGLIIVAGRQANYLNVSLAALLQILNGPLLKISFVNSGDRLLPINIKQVATRPNSGLSASRQLAILDRENFDVVGISTLSDAKTVHAAVEIANRHLVLAGMPAAGINEAETLLKHLQPNTLSPRLMLGQVFVRRLCEHCREAYTPDAIQQQQLAGFFQTDKPSITQQLHELEKLAKAAKLGDQPLASTPHAIQMLYRAQTHGCRFCDYTGYDGEIGVFEISVSQERAISLQVDGLIKALRGLIDLPTLLSICTAAMIK